ncbi:MAG TPA: rod shape-determining protein MreC [Acidimicrobiia bacterium]|jgi:rod shape-determining protein MreC
MAVYRRTSRRRSVLILLVLTSITLITIDARSNGGGVTRTVRDAARDTMAPVQSAVDDVLSPVADWFDGVAQSGNLKDENRTLRRELAQARGEAAQSRAVRRENQELRKLAQLPLTQNLPGVNAQVIAGSPGNFESTVTLDRGSDVGIATGMPVVTGDGLVGRVVQASRKRATVLLLTDPSSGVAVRLEKSGGTGVASGRAGSNLLGLDFVNPTFKVTKNELVSTADSSRYPPNIPVGRVASVKTSPGAIEQTILVQPLADIARSSVVRVLKFRGQAG